MGKVFIEIAFGETAREMVANKSNSFNETKIAPNDVYFVWFSKVLDNAKAMLSTHIPDGRYYEVTFNGDKNEYYLDTYIKESNEVIKGEQ